MSISYKIVSANFNFVMTNDDIKNNQICVICRKSIVDVEKKDSVIIGKCHHAFHLSCCKNHTVSPILQCPIDGTDFLSETYRCYDLS
jgi:hypothetical protein